MDILNPYVLSFLSMKIDRCELSHANGYWYYYYPHAARPWISHIPSIPENTILYYIICLARVNLQLGLVQTVIDATDFLLESPAIYVLVQNQALEPCIYIIYGLLFNYS